MGGGRAALECGLCGCEAVMADDNGLFWESAKPQPCLSCGYPGRVTVDDADDDRPTARWVELDETDPLVVAWAEAHPLQAQQLASPEGCISTLPEPKGDP